MALSNRNNNPLYLSPHDSQYYYQPICPLPKTPPQHKIQPSKHPLAIQLPHQLHSQPIRTADRKALPRQQDRSSRKGLFQKEIDRLEQQKQNRSFSNTQRLLTGKSPNAPFNFLSPTSNSNHEYRAMRGIMYQINQYSERRSESQTNTLRKSPLKSAKKSPSKLAQPIVLPTPGTFAELALSSQGQNQMPGSSNSSLNRNGSTITTTFGQLAKTARGNSPSTTIARFKQIKKAQQNPARPISEEYGCFQVMQKCQSEIAEGSRIQLSVVNSNSDLTFKSTGNMNVKSKSTWQEYQLQDTSTRPSLTSLCQKSNTRQKQQESSVDQVNVSEPESLACSLDMSPCLP